MNIQRQTVRSIVMFLLALSLFLNTLRPSEAFQVTAASSCAKIRDDQIEQAKSIAQTELKIEMNTAQEQFALCERTRLVEMQKCIDSREANRTKAEVAFLASMAACGAYTTIAPPAGVGCILVACAALVAADVAIQAELNRCGLGCARDYGVCLDARLTDFKTRTDASVERLNNAIARARVAYQNCISEGSGG